MRSATGFLVTVTIAALASWVVALGGLSAVTNDCYSNNIVNTPLDCARGMQYEWWGLWFEFFLMLVLLFFTVRRYVENNKSTLQVFVGMATCTLMWSARSFLSVDSFALLIETRPHAIDATAAGFVMMCVFNFVIIMAIGRVESATLPIIMTQAGSSAAGSGMATSARDGEGATLGAYAQFSDAPPVSTNAGDSTVTGVAGGSKGLSNDYFNVKVA